MKYHIQEHLWNKNDRYPRGSCYPTVIACLLDLELHDVPYFHLLYFRTDEEKDNIRKLMCRKYFNGLSLNEYNSLPDKQTDQISNYENQLFHALHWLWHNVLEFWMASRGVKETFIPREQIDQWIKNNPTTPYIVSGKSPRGISHVVIYINGKMIHDPHPSGAGVFETEDEKFGYSFIEPL